MEKKQAQFVPYEASGRICRVIINEAENGESVVKLPNTVMDDLLECLGLDADEREISLPVTVGNTLIREMTGGIELSRDSLVLTFEEAVDFFASKRGSLKRIV